LPSQRRQCGDLTLRSEAVSATGCRLQKSRELWYRQCTEGGPVWDRPGKFPLKR
jgi:hypothetical protein